MSQKNHKIGMVSLGCPKALVDSEQILTQLKKTGYDIVGGYQDADLVIVNTCGFIDEAKEESLQAISEALAENGKVMVTGCLSKADDSLQEKFPNLLSISGPQQYETVVKAVHQQLPQDSHINPQALYPKIPDSGIKLTPRHYAYLKISEGCNHKCSFCIIPDLRGKLSSRGIDDVLEEATQLHKDGVRELLVISQDTSAYGVDTRYQEAIWQDRKIRTRFRELCQELAQLPLWTRLHYVYPYPHVDEVIPMMAEGNLLPYLDIPFQHAHPDILKAMKRPASGENALERIHKWRQVCPELSIRSTFIVGFPGETEEHFESLLEFMRAARINHAGCFKYSAVDGARANELDNPVPESVKEERWHRFMALQASISAELLREKIGTTQQIIIDEVNGEHSVGRTRGDAPDIDGNVLIRGAHHYQAGDIVELTITDADEFDLHVELEKQDRRRITLKSI